MTAILIIGIIMIIIKITIIILRRPGQALAKAAKADNRRIVIMGMIIIKYNSFSILIIKILIITIINPQERPEQLRRRP